MEKEGTEIGWHILTMILKNKNFILIVLIIALGLIAWGVAQDNSFQANAPELKPIFSDSVDKIEIHSTEGSHVLVKEDDKWKIKEGEMLFPADEEAVKSVVEGLKNFKVSEIVSRNAEKYSTFGVDELAALQIVLYQKDVEFERVYVGNPDFRRGGNYARVGNIASVYITGESIRSNFLKSTYKDLHLSDVDTNTVTEAAFAFADNQKDFAVVKKAIQPSSDAKDASPASELDEWFYKDDEQLKQQLDKNAVTAVLSAIKNNVARGIAPKDTAKEYGFEKPTFVITMIEANGTRTVSFGSQTQDKSAYYASVSGKEEWVYEVDSSFVENILAKKKEDLLKKEDPKQ